MSGSGLIYVAVLGAWAAFLLTRCLKTTPADLESAVHEGKLLRRRGAPEPAATYSMLRPQAAANVGEPVVKAREVDRPVELVTRPRVSRATAARRRRMMTLLLGSATLLTLLHLVGLLPAWPAAIPAALFFVYLYEVRVQVRRSRVTRVHVPDAVPTPVRIPAQRPSRRSTESNDENWDLWPAVETETLTPGDVPDLGAGWEPRPVPLPTYVTAPKAPPVARRIDVSAGRPWTVDDDEATQEFPALTDELIAELDAEAGLADVVDLDHKRAVGE